MSTLSAASARSSVSVAVHIANRNPPRSTNSAIATRHRALLGRHRGKPSCRAMARFRSTMSTSQGAPA